MAESLRGRSSLQYSAGEGRIQVAAGGRPLGPLVVAPTLVELGVTVQSTGGYEPAEAGALVTDLIALAREMELPAVRLNVLDPVIRDAARSAGFGGPLRRPLVVEVSG